MVYKEVSRVEVEEIIRQWQTGRGIKAIARSTGISRNTIRKYLLTVQSIGLARNGQPPTDYQLTALLQLNQAGPAETPSPTDKILDPYSTLIEQWLKRDQLKLVRVQDLLAQKQCVVAYTCLRRYVRKKGWFGKDTHNTVRMPDTEPGQMAEIDFGRLGLIKDGEGDKKRLVWGMMTVLNYSRHQFLWPLFGQQITDVLEGLEATWAFFNGIPRYVILDNFPAAVVGADPLNPRLTRGFMEYAKHRGFIADPARPGHPKDKPKIERNVPYARERFFKGGQFTGLIDLREQARIWCLQVAGQRVHGTTRKLPLVVFQEEELSRLLPYDGELYDVPDWHKATVHPDHHIYYRYALYSAPYNTCPPGTELEVKGDSKLVRLYKRGELIKVHPRKPRGGKSTDQNDYPPELTPYTLRSTNYLCQKSAELGESVEAFARRLLGGPTPWSKMRQAYKLLHLGERYTSLRLNLACEKALSVDLIDVRRLEKILKEALEQEAVPAIGIQLPLPGRFARLGRVFAIGSNSNQVNEQIARYPGEQTNQGGIL
jgi:transposase